MKKNMKNISSKQNQTTRFFSIILKQITHFRSRKFLKKKKKQSWDIKD
jgi:hypothetical protein